MRRRAWFAAAGGAGLAGAGTLLYRAAPSFWRQFARELRRPVEPAARQPAPDAWPDAGVYGAWLGHATVLLKVDGFTILTDPVLRDRVGINLGIGTLGLKRLTAPALDERRLPRVDLILVSHAHFDHLDTPTLGALENARTSVVMASSTSDLVRVDRYREVRELGWGESAHFGPVTVRAFEVNHWGARMRTDTYRGYNGYLIESGRRRILFGGDTALTTGFRAVRSSKPFDLAILPIGAYNPWIRYHCTPEQAVRMGNDANADRFVPVHHQTFKLSSEPLLEPIERFHAAAGQDRTLISRIGEEFRVS